MFRDDVIPRISWANQAGLMPYTGTTRAPAFTENFRYFSPGEREPGEGECRPEEGGEAAERGGQVPRVCAEQPRASVHGTHPPEPRTPVPYSPRQLPPPAHHHSTLPALTCPATERRRWRTANRRVTSTNRETDWWHVAQSPHDRSDLTDRPVTAQDPNCNRKKHIYFVPFLKKIGLYLIGISGTYEHNVSKR